MKRDELIQAIDSLDEIKNFCDRQNYNTSTFINKNIIKIKPLLEKELERMDESGVQINCPGIEIVTFDEDIDKESYKNLQDKLNSRLREYVINDYKIIDYGFFGSVSNLSAYIKYTS